MSLWNFTEKKGALSLKQVIALTKTLNLKLPKRYIKQKFRDVDFDNSGALDFSEFKVFLRELRKRPEIEKIFTAITQGENSFTDGIIQII